MTDSIDRALRVDISRRAALGAMAASTLASGAAAAARINATPEGASQAMDRAIVARDAATLDTLIAPDLLWVRGAGVRTGKAAFVGGFATPGTVIEPFTPSEGRWLKSGDLAVFSAVNELRGTDNGEPFVDRHSFCDVWRRDREGWRLVYVQITRAPVPEK